MGELAPGEALARHGTPEIFNTDQGSQFTGEAFNGLLKHHGIAISMDGKSAVLHRQTPDKVYFQLQALPKAA